MRVFRVSLLVGVLGFCFLIWVREKRVKDDLAPRIMSILSWNCREIGHQRAILVLKDLVWMHKFDILFFANPYANKVDGV